MTETYTAEELLHRFENGNGLPTLTGDVDLRVTDIFRSERQFGYVVLVTEFGPIVVPPDQKVLVRT